MPFSFPASPSTGDKSTQNGREYEWSGYAWEIVATPASLNASVITAGTLDAARLPLATTIAAGAVIVGTGLGVSSGTVSVTYGTSAGTACQGNDARLSDTRTPTDGSVTTAKLANDAVTYAKIQNVSTTDRLLGRSSAGSGDVEEILCGSFGRSLIGSADAAAARTTLSVQPTASPAFTGTVLVGISSALNSSDGVQVAAANNPGVIIARTAAPSNTNSIAGVNATSYDGAAYVAGATINFRAAENWSSTNHGTDIQFRTTPTGSGGSLTETLRLTGAGQLLVTAGSGSSGSYKPGIAVSGDDDTGLQQVGGAGTISLVTQGSERVRVDASGNVGIGVSPTHRIDCNGEFRLRGTGASTEAGKLHLYWVSATNRATWTTDASGNALIETGASSPAERFRVGVNGRSQFFAASEKYGVQLNNGSTANGPFIGSDGADILTISTSGGAERMRVKATGSVRFVPLSADPSTGNEAGDVYYNSSTNKLRVYNGTSWVDLH